MASFSSRILLLATAAVFACSGCVVVNPSNVSVGGFSTRRGDPGPPETPYASALRDVIEQQAAVRTEINDRDWVEAGEEIDDWAQLVRKLVGYADTSRDPIRFRAYGNELLGAIERLRLAVGRQDAQAAVNALNACDPILNKFSRDFPLVAPSDPPQTKGDQQQSHVSPGASPPRSGSASPEYRVSVQVP